jgi:hypothetical protein
MGKVHSFRLILGDTGDFRRAADVLYGAGCDDALISRCDGVVSMDFNRDAPTRGQAITKAIRDVEAAGVGARVVRVEVEGQDPLVGAVNAVLALPSTLEADPALLSWAADRLHHAR